MVANCTNTHFFGKKLFMNRQIDLPSLMLAAVAVVNLVHIGDDIATRTVAMLELN